MGKDRPRGPQGRRRPMTKQQSKAEILDPEVKADEGLDSFFQAPPVAPVSSEPSTESNAKKPSRTESLEKQKKPDKVEKRLVI